MSTITPVITPEALIIALNVNFTSLNKINEVIEY